MFVLSKSYLKLRLDLYVWCLSRFINTILCVLVKVYMKLGKNENYNVIN